MYKLSKISVTALIVFMTFNVSQAESFWDKATNAVSDTATKVVDTGSDLVTSKKTTKAQDRETIDSNAKKAISRLFKESKEAKALYDKAAGYAVFDSREFSFMIQTGFGAGVAVDNINHSRTYMKMASGGMNIGGGIKYIQVIFIFPTKKALHNFINDGWTAGSDVNAVGGKDSSKIGMTLSDGTKIYELVDTGLVLKMSISGTKYWKDSDLN